MSNSPTNVATPAGDQAINLAILSDHQLFRECLEFVLAGLGRFVVVGRAADAETAIHGLKAHKPDVVLVDIGLSKGEAPDLIKNVCLQLGQVKLIILGLTESESMILECFEAGANGYISKESSLDHLVTIIESVFRGETVCSPRIAYSLFSRVAELSLERHSEQAFENVILTLREVEILQLITDGLSNKQIADQLFLSLHTVKNHVHKILEKLQLHRRAEAVNYALEKGLLKKRRHTANDL